ncbi:uncharacterized protein LOC133527375 [Cydia pomonella]|uniref:uncharacterized protein LOC133527375 n=1 Tax=Cydia pomonella TaxID=82600 RepID=UPI002ADD8E08|nr:uncharacterized protein LOC133527375 [Cydia pomonella]
MRRDESLISGYIRPAPLTTPHLLSVEDTMNSILGIALVMCASMALTSAYPAAESAQDISYIALEETAPVEAAADGETLQPKESRWRRGWGGGWGHRGWGHGGYGHGGWGRGWGNGGGWGHGGGWGYGGYGGGYGYGGGWGGGWYGR